MRLNKVKLLMECIDKEAASRNRKPKSGMTLAAANTCFSVRVGWVMISNNTPIGKRRDISLLKWISVMKYTTKKNELVKVRSLNISLICFSFMYDIFAVTMFLLYWYYYFLMGDSDGRS